MSDSRTRYCAIQKALKSLRPTELKGNQARHLDTLAMLITGVIGAKKCYLPDIAQKVPTQAKPSAQSETPQQLYGRAGIFTV